MSQLADSERAAVLVVDDNPLVLGVLRSLLVSENYAVVTSTNGKEALETLQDNSVDLIICDVMMPEMGGYDLHRAIRDDKRLSHVPFIFLTALGDPSEVGRGVESGADEYLVKPFDPARILSIVKGKLARGRMIREAGESRFEDYRRRVVHTLSHEFRTPLVAINTGTELLIDRHSSMPDDKVHHMLEAIQRGGQRLERLVSDFMLLQQVEAGVSQRLFDARGAVHTVGDVVERVCGALQEEIAPLGAVLHWTDQSNGARVRLYEPQFHEILARLVDNAVKFSPDNRSVEVICAATATEASIEVLDRGIGMSSDHLAQAGIPFGQLNRDKLEQQGSGFGLAIAVKFAAVNGGRIDISPRDGGGTSVRIAFPLFQPSSD